MPHILKVALREFSAGGASIALAVSNQNQDAWEPVQAGLPAEASAKAGDGGYWFKNSHGTVLKWKMTVTPGTNPEYSPFVGILDLDYEVKKLK